MIKREFQLRRTIVRMVATSLLAACMATVLPAADGDLDLTYGSSASGKNSVSLGASDTAYGSYLQADGKMIVVGGARPGTYEDFGVARFNVDGGLDTAFGTGGVFSLNISTAASPTDRATCVGVQSDGKIIVAGYTRGAVANEFCVIRLTAAGVLDTTFGAGGISQIDFNGRSDQVFALRVLSDDKIVLGGRAYNAGNTDSDYAVARLSPNGALDTSFGTGGKATLSVGNQQDNCNAMVVQADGAIVLGGQSNISGSNFGWALVRFTAMGVADTSFGTNGTVGFNLPGSTSDALNGLAVQADGKIVACGSNNTSNEAVIARFTTSGVLDSTFGIDGYAFISVGAGGRSNQLFSVLVQFDGKILAGGRYVNSDNQVDSILVRVTSAGALDSNFGSSGTKTFSFGAAGDGIVGLGIASSSKIVAGINTAEASSADDFGVARFLNTPANTSPTISNVADQATIQNVATSAIGFTVGDTETAAADLIVTGSSSNTALVSNSNIVFGGSGANRTATITPNAGQSGTSTITLTVTDQGSATASDAFVLTVTADNTPPTVTSVVRLTPSNQMISAGPVVFRVTYSEAVTNVTTSSFVVEAINGGDVVGHVTEVSGTGATREVTAAITEGSGGFRLNVVDLQP
jgi:uncharacterized delta-60 repeat protein